MQLEQTCKRLDRRAVPKAPSHSANSLSVSLTFLSFAVGEGFMHQIRRSFTLAATIAVLTLALSLCFASTIGASPATTRPSARSTSRVIGQQIHESLTGSAGGVSPQVTYVCDVYDYSSSSGQKFYPQVGVGCPLPATMTVDVYIDYCSYWNYSENYCAGGWVRQGGGLHCNYSSVTFETCPNPALGVTIPTRTAVRGDYVVSTTIPESDPPTDTGTYYGLPYTF